MPIGGGQAFIGGKVLAVNDELGAGALAVVARHQDNIGELFAVAAVHMRQKLGKGSLAGLTRTLVDVMRDGIGQTVQHALVIAAIEGIVIARQQRDGVKTGQLRGLSSRGKIAASRSTAAAAIGPSPLRSPAAIAAFIRGSQNSLR